MKRTKLMKLRCFDVLKVQCWKIDFAITPRFLFFYFFCSIVLGRACGRPRPHNRPAQPSFRIAP